MNIILKSQLRVIWWVLLSQCPQAHVKITHSPKAIGLYSDFYICRHVLWPLWSKLNQYWIKIHKFLSQKCIWKWFCTILTFSSRPQYVKFKIIDIYMYHRRNTRHVFLITSDDITSNSTVAILGQTTSNWASVFGALFYKGSRDSLWKN